MARGGHTRTWEVTATWLSRGSLGPGVDGEVPEGHKGRGSPRSSFSPLYFSHSSVRALKGVFCKKMLKKGLAQALGPQQPARLGGGLGGAQIPGRGSGGFLLSSTRSGSAWCKPAFPKSHRWPGSVPCFISG